MFTSFKQLKKELQCTFDVVKNGEACCEEHFQKSLRKVCGEYIGGFRRDAIEQLFRLCSIQLTTIESQFLTDLLTSKTFNESLFNEVDTKISLGFKSMRVRDLDSSMVNTWFDYAARDFNPEERYLLFLAAREWLLKVYHKINSSSYCKEVLFTGKISRGSNFTPLRDLYALEWLDGEALDLFYKHCLEDLERTEEEVFTNTVRPPDRLQKYEYSYKEKCWPYILLYLVNDVIQPLPEAVKNEELFELSQLYPVMVKYYSGMLVKDYYEYSAWVTLVYPRLAELSTPVKALRLLLADEEYSMNLHQWLEYIDHYEEYEAMPFSWAAAMLKAS